ncbi:hypothetical protein CB1_007024003 [Camelus ferus]|nr:hypothetical protein CB1_007024003 [Camelus ferus]
MPTTAHFLQVTFAQLQLLFPEAPAGVTVTLTILTGPSVLGPCIQQLCGLGGTQSCVVDALWKQKQSLTNRARASSPSAKAQPRVACSPHGVYDKDRGARVQVPGFC